MPGRNPARGPSHGHAWRHPPPVRRGSASAAGSWILASVARFSSRRFVTRRGSSKAVRHWWKLATMIRGIKVSMLTTMGPDRSLRSGPMASQQADFDGTLWFFTQAGSETTSEIRQHPQVNASFVSTEEHHYVSLTGYATVVQDREEMQELWSPALGR